MALGVVMDPSADSDADGLDSELSDGPPELSALADGRDSDDSGSDRHDDGSSASSAVADEPSGDAGRGRVHGRGRGCGRGRLASPMVATGRNHGRSAPPAVARERVLQLASARARRAPGRLLPALPSAHFLAARDENTKKYLLMPRVGQERAF